MADDNPTAQERTERATPRRREEARREGRIARSQELSAATVVLAGTAALAIAGGHTLGHFAAGTLREGARALAAGPFTVATASTLLQSTILGLALAGLPFVLGLAALVLLVNVVQARGVMAWKAVAPKWSHVSPVAGLKRLVSPEALFNLVKSLAKIAVLSVVTYLMISSCWPELMSLAGADPAQTAIVLRTLLIKLATLTGLAFLAISLADYGFQVFRMEKSLRMTRQEVVREHRDSEGDPLVKARILSIARARARQRMLQRAPTADVVVVNPTEIAVALKYDTAEAPAPVVVAMGQRKLAERIKALAIKHNVPVVENRPVARALLATATVGRMIPPALYTAIAEILAFVYRRRGTPAALHGAMRRMP
jgi:flagellar biosynthetic protein FlhB